MQRITSCVGGGPPGLVSRSIHSWTASFSLSDAVGVATGTTAAVSGAQNTGHAPPKSGRDGRGALPQQHGDGVATDGTGSTACSGRQPGGQSAFHGASG